MGAAHWVTQWARWKTLRYSGQQHVVHTPTAQKCLSTHILRRSPRGPCRALLAARSRAQRSGRSGAWLGHTPLTSGTLFIPVSQLLLFQLRPAACGYTVVMPLAQVDLCDSVHIPSSSCGLGSTGSSSSSSSSSSSPPSLSSSSSPAGPTGPPCGPALSGPT